MTNFVALTIDTNCYIIINARAGEIMYKDKIILTPKEILEKEFKIDARGYRMQEVDKFLDVVIGDYNELFGTIDRLEDEKEQLLNDIMRLKQEIRTIKTNLEVAKGKGEREVTNVDIIRRISQLEKYVYGVKNNIDE